MVRIKSFNEKLISYLSSDKNSEDIVDEAMLFKDKFNTRREENTYVSPSSDVKNVSYPTRNRRSSSFYRYKQKNGYQCQRSSLHNSITADSLFEEAINNKPEVTTTAMTAVVKRNKSTKGFFSSITKKLLNNKRSSISRKYSNHIHSGKSLTKKSSKFLLSSSLNRNVNNIPMQVVETLYTISFTKHSYYIQRSLRRSTMIVNLITRFRNTYEELREIDVPKLKRRISFKKRTPNNRAIKKADQPREGSLIELREQKRARYYSHFGDALQYNNYTNSYLPNYSQYTNTVSTMDTMETMSTNTTYETNTNTTVESVSHTNPRRRKKMPRKPLLEFSECESLPSIPASAAGSKVNHYLANHKETERKKLKPIKSIDKELCLIFNKEYIPEEQINQKTENATKVHKSSCEDLRSSVQKEEIFHSSISLPITPIPEIAPLPAFEEPEDDSENEIGPEDISIFIEEGEIEEKKPEPIPSPSSATTEVYIPEEDEQNKKERKRISEGTLYSEALDEKHPGNVSAESDSSDKTLKDEEINIPSTDSSFLVVDESVHQINFHIDSEEESDNSEDEKQSFMLKYDNNCQSKKSKTNNKKQHEDSFSLTDSFLLSDSSEESSVPEHMSKFLLNKTYSLSDDDFFNDSMSILNNSIINESFTLTLNNYGDDNIKSSKSYIKNIDTKTSFSKKDEKPLNRIDSGVDLSGMENISFLMATQCQI